MMAEPTSRFGLRFQSRLSLILVLTCVGLAAWLSTVYRVQFDASRDNRLSLSQASRDLLMVLDGPVAITAYVSEQRDLRRKVLSFVDRYRRYKSDIELNFVNPDAFPDLVREQGISASGELVVHFDGRSEHVHQLSERSLTNALQTLARATERWIVFLDGHGERNPFGRANHDFGNFGEHLTRRGMVLQTLNLSQHRTIPDNTSVLVIASPQIALLPGETNSILEYVDAGGNLLWLTEPSDTGDGLDRLAQTLGIQRGPGTLVDPVSQLYGIDHPAIVVTTSYPPHPVTANFNYSTVFPHAQPLRLQTSDGWDTAQLLVSGEHAWSETGALEGQIGFDAGLDVQGPAALGLSMTRMRSAEQGEQRIAVLGDGDFASNTYLGNSGNLDLGVRLLTWLARDDTLIDIPVRVTADRSLDLPPTLALLMAVGFLIVVPLTLLAFGGVIWWRRRRAL